jgi:hypothetical protein
MKYRSVSFLISAISSSSRSHALPLGRASYLQPLYSVTAPYSTSYFKMCRWNLFTYGACGCEDESPRLLQQCPFRTGFKHYIAAGKPPGATGAALQRACIVTMKILRTYHPGKCEGCRPKEPGGKGSARHRKEPERIEERDEGAALENSRQARSELPRAWSEAFDAELQVAERDLQPHIRELLHQFLEAYRNILV